jgi:hypothetical protein
LRRRRNAPRFFPSCSPIAPIIARTRGGSEAAILSRRSKRPFSENSMMVRLMVFSGDSSLVLPTRRKKSSNAASLPERLAHASGLRVWMRVSLPRSFRGRLSSNGFRSCRSIRHFRLGDVHHIFWQYDKYAPVLSFYVLAEGLRFFLTFAHRARAAFLASSVLSCGVRAAMRAFTPLPFAAFPPFLPISLITLETRSRLIVLSYDEMNSTCQL